MPDDLIRAALDAAATTLAVFDDCDGGSPPSERRMGAMRSYARASIVAFLRALPPGMKTGMAHPATPDDIEGPHMPVTYVAYWLADAVEKLDG